MIIKTKELLELTWTEYCNMYPLILFMHYSYFEKCELLFNNTISELKNCYYSDRPNVLQDQISVDMGKFSKIMNKFFDLLKDDLYQAVYMPIYKTPNGNTCSVSKANINTFLNISKNRYSHIGLYSLTINDNVFNNDSRLYVRYAVEKK